MAKLSRRPCVPAPASEALRLLGDAHGYAISLGRHPREFPVALGELLAEGVRGIDLRWLIARKFVEQHVQSINNDEYTGPTRGRQTAAGSCFFLTATGVEFALSAGAILTPSGLRRLKRPRFGRRQLLVGKRLVKSLRQPAESQETILMAFQEQRWTQMIDDPLPPRAGLDPKIRLRQTIANLNRNRKCELVHFFGDGTGTKVCWEWQR